MTDCRPTLIGVPFEVQEQILELVIPLLVNTRIIEVLTGICTRLRHVMLPILRRLLASYPSRVAEAEERLGRAPTCPSTLLHDTKLALHTRLDSVCEEWNLAVALRKKDHVLVFLKRKLEAMENSQLFRRRRLDTLPIELQKQILTLAIHATPGYSMIASLLRVCRRLRHTMLPILESLHASSKCRVEEACDVHYRIHRELWLAARMHNERSGNIMIRVWRERLKVNKDDMKEAKSVAEDLALSLDYLKRWQRPEDFKDDWKQYMKKP